MHQSGNNRLIAQCELYVQKYMSRKKKKINKKKKKFFIIVACYLAVFIITSVLTASTLAWFNSSTWQSEVLYMGGPVYIYFSDDTGTNVTSGDGTLVTELPDNWEKLYPGMNMRFQAKAVLQGHTFHQKDDEGNDFIQYTTTAVLRARIMLYVTAPGTIVHPDTGEILEPSAVANELYNFLWPQLKAKALADTSNPGVWVFDELDGSKEENNYFYYVERNQAPSDTGEYKLMEVGGKDLNEQVGFLNNAIIQLPGIETDNRHADCDIKFKIVFQALQAFFPYQKDEIGDPYQGDTTGRSEFVMPDDVGLGKPLTLGNSRRIFEEATFSPENGWELT